MRLFPFRLLPLVHPVPPALSVNELIRQISLANLVWCFYFWLAASLIATCIWMGINKISVVAD